ncbi:MAG: glycosyltransferase, partial [Bacteroidota bacterium]
MANNHFANPPFHVVYLGECGFPLGLANIQKMILVSKSLIKAGAKVTVINRKGKFDPDEPQHIAPNGIFEGIHYVYTSGSIYRPKGFFRRNLQKLYGIWQEFLYLRDLKKKGELQAGIISCYHLGQVILYRLYASLLGFPVVLNYVEWASSMQHRNSWTEKINDYIFDNWVVRSMHGALAISEVLMDNFRQIAPQKGLFKLPILCDFEQFNLPKNGNPDPYFLYCGGLSYREVIDFILKAYDQLPEEPYMNLYLVLGGGTKQEYEVLKKDIAKMQKADRVKVFLDVPHQQIPGLYIPAKALLIPLRPTLQDAARFPHKIGEYVASGNPMIATNYGEVAHYFKDEETALVANSYEVAAFAERMQFVLQHPEKAQQIGEKGKAL